MPAELTDRAATEVGRICSHKAVTIGPDEDVIAAARLMRSAHLGFLVVLEGPADGPRRVVGVLTDRDIVVSVVARDADSHLLRVSDVMTRNPLMVSEDCAVESALTFMRDAGVRRVPVIRGDHELVGVLSLDDAIDSMARQLTNVASAYQSELRAERIGRP